MDWNLIYNGWGNIIAWGIVLIISIIGIVQGYKLKFLDYLAFGLMILFFLGGIENLMRGRITHPNVPRR